MRLAVLSDIHGNAPALEAVLTDIKARSVDLIVNLGDILSGPLFPNETADILRPLDLPTIAGNHERQLLTLAPGKMNLSDRYTRDVLREDHLAWLANLPARAKPVPDVLMTHGSPKSDVEYWMETFEDGKVRPATLDEVKSRTLNMEEAVLLCGHTHIPRTITLNARQRVVNPGSVGLPAYDDIHPVPHVMETNDPRASYAVVGKTGKEWNVDFHLVDYDFEVSALQADRNGRPEWARALREGKATLTG